MAGNLLQYSLSSGRILLACLIGDVLATASRAATAASRIGIAPHAKATPWSA
jgi:hypothetical protein